MPLNVVRPLPVRDNDPLLRLPVPERVTGLPLPVAMDAAPLTVKLFASVAPPLLVNVPPFSARVPVPNPLVATPTVNVPVVKVTAPLKRLLLAPVMNNVPLLLCVRLAAPLKLPLNVVVAGLVFVNVPLVNVPAPLKVKLLLPANATVPATV